MAGEDRFATQTSKPERISASQLSGETFVHEDWPEYDLAGEVLFDPPLTPEERRRRGVGIPIEERIEQARRQIADGSAWD